MFMFNFLRTVQHGADMEGEPHVEQRVVLLERRQQGALQAYGVQLPARGRQRLRREENGGGIRALGKVCLDHFGRLEKNSEDINIYEQSSKNSPCR